MFRLKKRGLCFYTDLNLKNPQTSTFFLNFRENSGK